ncbi:secretin N-terminal domain-containing protein [Burkholderia pseudomallei]|uniref:secretin N-terminal domain-containing protein n=1 Tax=Burkholderia pseudomallei TaxID=28450 RepID=UPI00052A2354|nr:secretin N-terminal domain-containing protein [Burkholderia pseudomallei]AIV86809.1 bacterial type II/III secretion system short domain protein [Burkholderia pseudomallei B03]AIV93930.1 bacterial type II/III secretion system short domain protein [Burkholderia pseudomallei A79A]KGY02653.1 bacterial type II/III secretion system short domain protein [Burkholderia pseudomallei A79D]KGY03746.1 bacterial type II/III secretion system short domain protein [Burkholderia pseudomallei A79C]
MTRRAAASAAAVALALASHAAALRAVPLAWPLARFDYRVGPVNAADALGELSRRSGIAIDVDARAPCRLDVREALPPRRFVERLARTCGLVSYYDGAVLQLVAPDAFEHAAVRLNYATLAELRAALARQRIVDARWRPGYDDAARIARVAGPPRYVALVLAAARALDEAAQTRVRTETRAFRLRARAAADRVVRGDGDGDDAVLPGLATRLRRRLEQDGAAPRAVPGVREFTASLPIVDADARSNTVLIRDVPARLARDARLVAQLDTRPASIRIDAFGATLAPAQLDALGLRWRDDAPALGASRDAGDARDVSRASAGVRPVGASRPSGARNEAAAAEARRAPALSAAPDASGASAASAASGPSAASGAPDAVDASAGSADSPRASAVRIAIVSTPAGCAPVRARIAELAAHGDASIDADDSTLALPDSRADFGRLRLSFVASGDGDARALDARRNGFAMRVTPHETAQPARYALDIRIVERRADGDAAGASSRETVAGVTLAAGECAALALPSAAHGEQRLVLVTPRAVPADPARLPPQALPNAPAAAAVAANARGRDTAEPAARAQAAAHAHPPAAPLPSPSAGLGLRAQTRLLGN